MDSIHAGEDYNSEAFDALGYLRQYRLDVSEFYKDILDDVHCLFLELELEEGSRQLDLGSGGSIHMALTSTRMCSQVTMAEFAPQNRKLIQRWIDSSLPEFDWKSSFDYIANKEGRSPKEIEDRVRNAIREVIPFDAKDDWPVFPQNFDLVTSCLCLGSACSSVESYKEALKKTSGYLKDGGYIMLIGSLNESKYAVVDKVFQVLPLTKKDIEDGLIEAGYKDIRWCLYSDNVEDNYISDSNGHYILSARKNKK